MIKRIETNGILNRKKIVMTITTVMLLSSISGIFYAGFFAPNVSAPSNDEIWFMMEVEPEATQDVGTDGGSRIAEYFIRIENFKQLSAPPTQSYTIELTHSIPDPTYWAVQLIPNTITFTFDGVPPEPNQGSVQTSSLTVEFIHSGSGVLDDEIFAAVTVTGTVTNPPPSTNIADQRVHTETILNRWQNEMEIDDPYKFINSGGTVYYSVTVTNVGKNSDSIDMTYSTPSSGWFVYFDTLIDTNSDPQGYPDTGTLLPDGSTTFPVRITAPGGAVKYDEESIDIIGTSFGGSSEFSVHFTKTTVVNTVFCVSDEDGNNEYYPLGKFKGHNVNPGYSTIFKIFVFKMTNAGTPYSVDLTINGNPVWTPELLTPSTIVFDPSDPILSLDEARLRVTAPSSASLGTEEPFSVSGDDGSSTDDIDIIARVVEAKKVYILNIDGMRREFLYLDDAGGPLDPGDTPLMPNLWYLAGLGSMYDKATDVLPSITGTDHVSIITSERVGEHGLYGVGSAYAGVDPSTGLFDIYKYSHGDIQGEILYDTIKSADPNLRTVATAGKHWVADIFYDNGVNVDIKSHGSEHPFYVDEPEMYWMGSPDYPGGGGTDHYQISTEASKWLPSDQWIIESFKRIIECEDPDFSYVLLANCDDGGHLYGDLSDPDPYKNSLTRPLLMRNNLERIDAQIGVFINYLKSRMSGDLAFKNSVIIVTADHGMSTIYQTVQTTQAGDLIYRSVDVREILHGYGIQMGIEYDWCGGEGPYLGIYGFKDSARGSKEKNLQDAKNYLSNYHCKKIPDGTDYEKAVWVVLDRSEMPNFYNEHTSKIDNLYNPYIGEDPGAPYEWPDLWVFTERSYTTPIYDDLARQGMNAFLYSVPWVPPWFTLRTAPGAHATWSEQQVPLIFEGPGIKQGYVSNEAVEVLDVIPTICALNNWPLPDGTQGKVLDCLQLGTDFDPELVADSVGNLHCTWWDISNQILYAKNPVDGPVSGGVIDTGKQPDIAIDPVNDNIIYIIWTKEVTGVFELHYRKSTDGGTTWSSPSMVTRTTTGSKDAFNPRIVVDTNQHAHIVWEENRDGDLDIFSMDNWANEQAVTTDNIDSRQPDLACEVTDTESDGGYSVHVVWQSLDAGGKTNIYHREGTIDGANGVVTWINPVTLVDDPNSNAKDPAVAVDCYENVNVVWADDRDGGWRIYLHVGWLGSGTHGNRGWSSSEPSGPPKGPDSSPLFPISDVAGYDASSPDLVTSFYHVTWNHIDIVWHDNRPQGVETDYEIYYQRVDTCSNAWVCGWNGQDNKISDDAIDSMTPSIAVTPTGLHTVWADDIIYQNIGTPTPVVHPCLQSLPGVVWDPQICVVGYAPPGPGNCRAVQLYLNGQQYSDPVYPSQSPDDCGVFIVYNVPLNIGLNTITATSIDLNLGYESEQAPIQTVDFRFGRISPGIFFDHAQYLQGINMVVSDYPNISPFGTIVLYTVYGTDTYTPTGQITIGIAGEVITLDPAMAIDIESRNAVTQIYNGLYDVDYDGMLVPCLAIDHFISPDGKDYTFTLRPDVKFQDNSDFDAYDVKYTFERILGLTSEELNSPYRPNYDLIMSINVIDNRTIEFHLSEPSPSFLSYMTMGIIPYNFTESGGNFYDNPVGTGPFKFDGWESPTNIQFTKFDDHFNGRPKLDDVIFSTIPDDILRVTTLLSGAVDLIERVSPSSTSLIDGSPNAEMRTSDYTDLVSIGLQNNVITLDQSLEREALNYAINRDATHAIYDSWANPSEGIIPPKSWAYNHEQDDGFDYDTEKAIELLMAAGWYDIDQDGILEGENGEEFYITLKYPALDIEAEQMANIVTENLSEIGIRVLKQPLDWLTYNYNRITKDFEMMIFFEPNLIAIDPDYMYSMFHSSAIPNGTNNGFNFVSYQSGCVDELLESARTTTDPDTRITLYQDAGDEIVHGGKVKGI